MTLLWLVLAGVLAAAEILSLTYVLGLLSVAAVAAGITAQLSGPVWLQLVVAALSSVLLLVGVLPVARRHAHTPATVSGTAALVGRQARVTAAVDGRSGQIKLAGEIWSARSLMTGLDIPVDAPVSVVRIDGATAVVVPLELEA